jgi:hypothetical protein
MADKLNDDDILAQNLRPVKVKDKVTTEQRMATGKRPINRLTQEGTQTNVPEAGGQSVRYRKQMGAGRRGKQASDVFLVSDPAGGDAGRVGVSTLGGKMKYKAASTSPEGEATTGFINPFRAKRARRAIEATPSTIKRGE